MIRTLLAVAIVAALSAPAQTIRTKEPSSGKLLVAKRDLPDPNFAESVVLLLEYSRKGAMGLVLNRPTGLSVSRVFRDIAAAKDRFDPVYAGGPVERGTVHALQRSKSKIEDARLVVDEVFIVSEPGQVEKSFAAGVSPSDLRFYAGYSGWGPGQLDREIDLGVWVLLDADAATIFSTKPDALWEKLIRRSEIRLAYRPEHLHLARNR